MRRRSPIALLGLVVLAGCHDVHSPTEPKAAPAVAYVTPPPVPTLSPGSLGSLSKTYRVTATTTHLVGSSLPCDLRTVRGFAQEIVIQLHVNGATHGVTATVERLTTGHVSQFSGCIVIPEPPGR